MRVSKYILAAAGVVAIFAIAVWLLRDNLVQRISNPLLREYGLSVTYVSLDALAVHDASISYLELLHDNGTTIAIRDLTLPIGGSSTRLKTYRAREVSIVRPPDTEGEPPDLAQLTEQFLLLPDNLGNSEVVVGEVRMPPYPTASDVRWILRNNGEQSLQATVASIPMSASIKRTSVKIHDVLYSLPAGVPLAEAHSVAAKLQQSTEGFALTGSASLDLPAWEPVAKLVGIVPDEIDIASGTAELRFAAEIPADATLSPTLGADLAPVSPLEIMYSGGPDDLTSILVQAGSPVTVSATFPDTTWSLQQAQSSLLVSYGEWQEIPLTVTALSCRDGPVCSMNTRVLMSSTKLPPGKVSRAEFTSANEVLFPDDGVRVNVRPDATLRIDGFSTAETRVARIDARLVSAATLELVDAGWQFAADSVDAKIGAMSVAENIELTAPLFLENIFVSQLDATYISRSVVYAALMQATRGEQVISLPGLTGNISLQGADVLVDLKTVGLHRNATIKARHNLDRSTGRLNVREAVVSLAAKKLSKRVTPWPNEWDLIAGTVALDLDGTWMEKKSALQFDLAASTTVADVAGYYADTAFTGLATTLKATYRSATGFSAEQSAITVGLVDIGIPIENIRADYTPDLNAPGVEVKNLSMTAFGGAISADPFSFHTETATNTLSLRADSIELSELFSLQEFESIKVSGRVAAVMPVTVENGTVMIADGTLNGVPPGGVIQYRPGGKTVRSEDPNIDFVTRTLSNFHYKSLASTVNLSQEGDLTLKLRLEGRNPDMDEKRPVVLNLGVEDNIPQLLRSLQAARTIEDILEKRLK